MFILQINLFIGFKLFVTSNIRLKFSVILSYRKTKEKIKFVRMRSEKLALLIDSVII